MNAVNTVTISKKDRFVQVSSLPGGGKTTYLLGVAYMMDRHNKKVVWLSVNGFLNPHDHATVLECHHINQLEHYLERLQEADIIILDDLHQVDCRHDQSSVDVLIAYISDIPEHQTRYYSLQSRNPS